MYPDSCIPNRASRIVRPVSCNRNQESRCRNQETCNRRHASGDRKQDAGIGRHATGDRKQDTGIGNHVSWYVDALPVHSPEEWRGKAMAMDINLNPCSPYPVPLILFPLSLFLNNCLAESQNVWNSRNGLRMRSERLLSFYGHGIEKILKRDPARFVVLLNSRIGVRVFVLYSGKRFRKRGPSKTFENQWLTNKMNFIVILLLKNKTVWLVCGCRREVAPDRSQAQFAVTICWE